MDRSFTGFPETSNRCMVIFNHFLPYFIVKAQKNSRLRRAMYYFQLYIIRKPPKIFAPAARNVHFSMVYL